MTLTATHEVMGYKATLFTDKVGGFPKRLVVEDVPIFCECARDKYVFDADWIARATSDLFELQRGGYCAPMHVKHHEPVHERNDSIEDAGVFKLKDVRPITYRGKRLTGVIADLIFTDPMAIEKALNMRLPYRSVEIFRPWGPPKIDGLALLTHEAPFLKLPMMMISDVKEVRDSGGPNVNFRESLWVDTSPDVGPVVGFFERGDRAHLLFRMTSEDYEMVGTATTDDEKKVQGTPAEGVQLQDGEGKDDEKKDGEDMQEGGGFDVGPVVKAIESGDIPVKDLDAILAAIQKQKGASESPENPEEHAAPAPPPGAEVMKDKDTAKLDGRIAALEMRDERRTADEEVRSAYVRLKDKALGSNLEDRLQKYREKHGAVAFADYVDGMDEAYADLSDDNVEIDHRRGKQAEKATPAAMKFSAAGPDVLERAMRFSSEYEQLRKVRMVRTNEETYIANLLLRDGLIDAQLFKDVTGQTPIFG